MPNLLQAQEVASFLGTTTLSVVATDDWERRPKCSAFAARWPATSPRQPLDLRRQTSHELPRAAVGSERVVVASMQPNPTAYVTAKSSVDKSSELRSIVAASFAASVRGNSSDCVRTRNACSRLGIRYPSPFKCRFACRSRLAACSSMRITLPCPRALCRRIAPFCKNSHWNFSCVPNGTRHVACIRFRATARNSVRNWGSRNPRTPPTRRRRGCVAGVRVLYKSRHHQ